MTLPSQPGDHFLRAGDNLRVHAGDDVVMKPWRVPAGQVLCFDWDASGTARPAQAIAQRRKPNSLHMTHQRRLVAQLGLTDLCAALLMCSGR